MFSTLARRVSIKTMSSSSFRAFTMESAGEAPIVGGKVFVSQLPWAATWQDVKDHFHPAGTVIRAKVVMDRDTRRSKGYGFVEFATQEDADRAIAELDQSELLGRRINVQAHLPKNK